MMKKNLLIAATAIALVGLVLVGGTLAWFTDKDEATNVVTMGNIDILVWEDLPDTTNVGWTAEWYGDKTGVAEGDRGILYAGVMPGSYVTKAPMISNLGANNAYMRTIVTVDVTAADGETKLPAEGIRFVSATDPNSYSIKRGSGVTATDVHTLAKDETSFTLYYDGVFQAKTGEMPFTNVIFPESWGNEYQDASIVITVTAEAIQSDNLDVGGLTGKAAAEKAFTDHFVAE